ncbi:MAG: RNB domain-containing ribonuclease, partial [Collinsella sp.]
SRLKADFFILPEDTSAERLGVHPGDAVVARILTYPTRLESGTVTIERRIGGDDAPDLGVQYVMARYGYTDTYPEAALTEAEALSLDVASALKDPLRRDLRDRFVITIDPVDARDFDDAISLERTPEGGYKLGVHIAAFRTMLPGTDISIWKPAIATSVYLADRVLPMLPERLSTICARCVPTRTAWRLPSTLNSTRRVACTTLRSLSA